MEANSKEVSCDAKENMRNKKNKIYIDQTKRTYQQMIDAQVYMNYKNWQLEKFDKIPKHIELTVRRSVY